MKIKQLRPSGCTSAVRKLLAVLLFLASANAIQAADVVGDTLEVRFRVGQSNLEVSFADNERSINEFVEKVKARCAQNPDLNLKLDVYGGASPEGPNELNRRLGEQRGISLKEVLMSRLQGCIDQITVVNQGARWGGLYNMIQSCNEPWKYEVLDVLMKPDKEEDGFQRDPRETKLRKMRNGTIWKALQAKYLPPLRSSGSAVVLPMTDEELENAKGRRGYGDGYCDTLVIRDTIIYLPEPCPQYEEPIDSSWVWAIKTNFILWGLAAPNGQVEFPLGRNNRWSIEGEVFWPWWIWSHSSHAHQCGNVGLELKYWLGDRKQHHTIDGWHIGLGVAAGYYDFEWTQHKGYQGEYLNIYGNLGYQHRFGKRKQWAVDAGLAIGWIPTKYREYLGSSIFPVGHEEEYDDHLMWQRSSSKHILGLTHANITLAYLIHPKSKKNQQVEEYTPVAPVAATYTTARPVSTVPAASTVPATSPAGQTAADAKAAKAEAKAAAAREKAEQKAAEKRRKAAEKAAKADAEAAEKAAKADAEAAAKAAESDKAAAKAAKQQAEADAKAAKAQAEADARAAKQQAEADARAAKQQAEADAKAAKAQAEADAKAAKAEAEAAAAREKAAAKAAKAEAKAAAKQQAESAAVGYAAAVPQPTADKAAAKQAAAEAKAAEARAKAEAKEAEARAKAEAKAAAKAAKEQAKSGNVTAAQEAIAAKARAEAAAKNANATAEQEAIAAKARAEAAAKEAAKRAKEEEKAARKAAKN